MAQNFDSGYGNAAEYTQPPSDFEGGYGKGQQKEAQGQQEAGPEQQLQSLAEQFAQTGDTRIAVEIATMVTEMMGVQAPPAGGGQAPQGGQPAYARGGKLNFSNIIKARK